VLREKETMNETSIRVIQCGGLKKELPTWKEKLLARGSRKGYKFLLDGQNVEIPKTGDTTDDMKEEGKEQTKVNMLNALAYDDLILSMDTTKTSGRIAFSFIKRAKSEDYKDGNATIAWQNLL
jgi:hypothetical protein